MPPIAGPAERSAAPPQKVSPGPEPSPPVVPHGPQGKAFQLHSAFIVEETAQGIQVIDQHALHERILREQLEARVKEARVAKQRLLVPATVQLSPKEFSTILDLREMLGRLGVEIVEFGRNTVAVQTMPQPLDRYDPAQFVRDILDEFEETGEQPTLAQKLDRIINLAACKGAVKAGQSLKPEEIQSLLAQRGRLQNPSVCAHGRPATILLTFEYLRKQFARR
jgi:DNA mismatch repair protein MutL